jgi:hypothetical protein
LVFLPRLVELHCAGDVVQVNPNSGTIDTTLAIVMCSAFLVSSCSSSISSSSSSKHIMDKSQLQEQLQQQHYQERQQKAAPIHAV